MANTTIVAHHYVPDLFFGGILKKGLGLIDKAAGLARNLPGPIGGIAGFVDDRIGPTTSYQGGTLAPVAPVSSPYGGVNVTRYTGPLRNVTPPTITGRLGGTYQSSTVPQGNGCAPAPCGYRKARSTYARKIDPGQPFAPGNIQVVYKGDLIEGRSRRRFNAANGRANNRAISRLNAGEAQAKKLLKAIGYRHITKS